MLQINKIQALELFCHRNMTRWSDKHLHTQTTIFMENFYCVIWNLQFFILECIHHILQGITVVVTEFLYYFSCFMTDFTLFNTQSLYQYPYKNI